MSLIRKHVAVLQAWACLDLVVYYYYSIVIIIGYNYHRWPAVMEFPFWQPTVV